ncbi:transcriptional regulator swi6 [Scheffersomyces spartinae]|uniref:Transcriptional regulator swi6 n=1 Tax=Scheffersomyces spartinae TaxID=45513 RepID=A0A9P8AHD8_9ASCO|nr:transcriptional regulator swi6 [Scheffersomyces spartinae]KAG7192402.1 transcriptional regulator swi6 [Scheffersomyces spartinae]
MEPLLDAENHLIKTDDDNSTNGHIDTTFSSTVASAIHSEQRMIQLNIKLESKIDLPAIRVLRRVVDSYVNVNQLLSILVSLGHLTEIQVKNFITNEILTNLAYNGITANQKLYNDYREHENAELRGIWIPYDKAVDIALKFDIYEFVKRLFLVDVHDFDQLPRVTKRALDNTSDDDKSSKHLGSPPKKIKLEASSNTGEPNSSDSLEKSEQIASLVVKLAKNNNNAPYPLPPITSYDLEDDEIQQLKLKYSEVFKRDNEDPLSSDEIESVFSSIKSKSSDVPLDQSGATALHFASALASLNLVSSFIKLGLNSPIRGKNNGETPLISTIMVTNAMEKGNFVTLLKYYLYPNLWLYSNSDWSFLHYLASQSNSLFECSKFYLTKILEVILENNQKDFYNLIAKVVNLQDKEHANTCLHLAAERESKWLISLLLSLHADPNIENNQGVKANDFDIVKEVVENKKDYENDLIFELVNTGIEFMNYRLEVGGANSFVDEVDTISTHPPSPPTTATTAAVETDESSDTMLDISGKIFRSIQDLMTSTNKEYETIINAKRHQIKQLNESLKEATIVTANNRFMTKKMMEKLLQLDNLRLQNSNMDDRLENAKKQIPDDEDEEGGNGDIENKQFDADAPFIIKPLYERLVNGEPIEDLKQSKHLMELLPSVSILRARVDSYEEVTKQIEQELESLTNYTELTEKFKKVVSICTGVDVNEVDDLLDGLLEAVEIQQ